MEAKTETEGEQPGNVEPSARISKPPETGPFVLRTLFEDLPLSADGDREDIEIKCVEFLEQNLYVGTSASELLHFVQIPPDPQDASGKPSYILASRLLPAYHEPPSPARPGVQQILLLPTVNKACILCNWTVTFYSLPELSPVFGTKQIRPCNWIGGIDLNSDLAGRGQDQTGPVTVLVSLNKKMRVIRIGEDDARPVRVIDFSGSTISVRRESFACVANARSYALLDVDRLLKIPLFPISSLDDSQSSSIGGQVEDISGGASGGISRSTSSAQAGPGAPDDRGHGRSTSLGTFMNSTSRRLSQQGRTGEHSGRETPEGLFRESSPGPAASPLRRDMSPSANKPLPPPPNEASSTVPPSPALPPVYLKPHIASPTPQEFLLVTGTGPQDSGVGMFVNLEGDITRPTIEFDVYPESIVVDGRGVGVDPTPITMNDEEEGFVLASMARQFQDETRHGLEIQRWDVNPGEGGTEKSWLEAPQSADRKDDKKVSEIGLRSVIDVGDVYFHEVVAALRLKRFHPFTIRSAGGSTLSLHSVDSRTTTSLKRVSGEKELFESGESLPKAQEVQRDAEEQQFAERLAHTRTRVIAWSGKNIWWAVRNPLALRLDAALSLLTSEEAQNEPIYRSLDRQKVVELINSLRGREAKTETEFLSLGYVRQRAGLLIFMSILSGLNEGYSQNEHLASEEALLEGGLDPRVILSIVPYLRNEIVEGGSGIWIHGGVKAIVDDFVARLLSDDSSSTKDGALSDHVLQYLRRFLGAWRKKKGFGSIANENGVFRSVDAALLVVLLQLDKDSPRGPVKGKSVRSELYELVDHGVDCFERAISLLESHNRLYVLSRLYQSRKMTGEVLGTWRRIVEGDVDEGGEFRDGEQRIREHLSRIRNTALVQEYGVWLAGRNPKLGVQVFAEDRSLVKFEPTQVVEILREGAPGAVKDYLEYLVFSKNHAEYINELIAYYLDIVTSKLGESKEARATLIGTYESYRALRPPKPTYRQFITDNTIDEEWWHSRLRLLQLLGGSQGSASNYDVAAILERIAAYTEELVPEVIILDGRQSHHEEALRLLTHGLGDYDTAISYCLLGGSSIYHPVSGTVARESLPTREQQAKLFGYLLSEFLRIEDVSNRVEQTSSLLERFGGWLDVGYVLSLIPDTWSVELVSGFLVGALRRIVTERSETMIAKALSGAENLKVSGDLIGEIDKAGPSIEA
ncbi:Transforming growth factor-beta receptor-associated protein [Lachnellula occidentalis]|uniref:Transforming growth factor-beta receptor-associated protein n=1 Tax=Lachnellula occidentalis TaxID=215460 RepID=A0A8H8UJR0_9HELO|nr:Transforming growth factor-beta receptor-associated protein [Lachnellula occidentalis]